MAARELKGKDKASRNRCLGLHPLGGWNVRGWRQRGSSLGDLCVLSRRIRSFQAEGPACGASICGASLSPRHRRFGRLVQGFRRALAPDRRHQIACSRASRPLCSASTVQQIRIMRIRLFNPNARRAFKAAERERDRSARRKGLAEQRQDRNRFIPNSRDWEIKEVPAPHEGIHLA